MNEYQVEQILSGNSSGNQLQISSGNQLQIRVEINTVTHPKPLL